MDRAFAWLHRLSILAIIAMVVYVGMVEHSPITYINVPFPVLTRIVHPGDSVLLTVTRHSDEPDEAAYPASRWFVNVDSGEHIPLKATTTSVSPGLHTDVNRNLIVPDDFLKENLPGTYYAAGCVAVDGKIRNFKVCWRSQEFEIRK